MILDNIIIFVSVKTFWDVPRRDKCSSKFFFKQKLSNKYLLNNNTASDLIEI